MLSVSDELRTALTRIDALKHELDALRPTLTPDVLGRVFQKFRLDWNYHSNSIEGNTLTYGETVAFLMEGVTAKGKPLKDHLDLRGHNAAIDFLLDLVKDDRGISEAEIRELHKLILVEPYTVQAETASGLPTSKVIQLGQYKTMPNHVRTRTGAIHYYASPEETPAKMQELLAWYRDNREALHPLVLAALFHHKFVAIHPFDDGNGRMTRLLTNLLLLQAGLPVVVVKTDEKSEYYGVLSQADQGIEEPLLLFFAERLIRSLELYLRGVRGEDIADESDLDKEIALLRASIDRTQQRRKVALSAQVSAEFADHTWEPLEEDLTIAAQKIAEFFLDTRHETRARSKSGKTHNETDMRHIFYSDWFTNEFGQSVTGEQLHELEFACHWLAFQGGPPTLSPFDITSTVYITFDLYTYRIAITNSNFSAEYMYGTALTHAERATVAEAFLRKALDQIKQRAPY